MEGRGVTFRLKRNGAAVGPPTTVPYSVDIETVLQKCESVQKHCGHALMSTHPQNAISASLNHSFIGSLFDAYNYHFAIEIRPDDVWLAIVIALADYVNKHAEEMRHLFVSFQDKKQLIVMVDRIEHWDDIIAAFSVLINENTNPGVRDFMEPHFSTTTQNDRLIARVTMMASMQKYFSYGVATWCGIPSVTMLGTAQDWLALRAKVLQMGDMFGANQQPIRDWQRILMPIVDEFIASYGGAVNDAFWQSCACKHEGSGGNRISGWVCAFSPFSSDGEWRLNAPDHILQTGDFGRIGEASFTSATVEVPLKIKDGNIEYEAYFYAGGIVSTYDRGTNTIRPSFDYALFRVPDHTFQNSQIDWNVINKTQWAIPLYSCLFSGLQNQRSGGSWAFLSQKRCACSLQNNRSHVKKLEKYVAGRSHLWQMAASISASVNLISLFVDMTRAG